MSVYLPTLTSRLRFEAHAHASSQAWILSRSHRILRGSLFLYVLPRLRSASLLLLPYQRCVISKTDVSVIIRDFISKITCCLSYFFPGSARRSYDLLQFMDFVSALFALWVTILTVGEFESSICVLTLLFFPAGFYLTHFIFLLPTSSIAFFCHPSTRPYASGVPLIVQAAYGDIWRFVSSCHDVLQPIPPPNHPRPSWRLHRNHRHILDCQVSI